MQKRVEDFVRSHGLSADITTRYIDLTSEVGELGKEIVKATQYGAVPFTVSPAFADELGDCIFSLLCICVSAGVSAEDALHQSLQKYRARMKSKGSIDSDQVE